VTFFWHSTLAIWLLGPILFLLYATDLLKLIKRHWLSPHAYADTQIYGFSQPSDVKGLADRVSACFDEVSSWMRDNRLQVNPSKTEVLWCASGRRQHQIPTSSVRIGSTYVLPVFSVGDLGYILTPTSVCEHMSLPPSDRALQHYVRFGVFGVVFHNTPC